MSSKFPKETPSRDFLQEDGIYAQGLDSSNSSKPNKYPHGPLGKEAKRQGLLLSVAVVGAVALAAGNLNNDNSNKEQKPTPAETLVDVKNITDTTNVIVPWGGNATTLAEGELRASGYDPKNPENADLVIALRDDIVEDGGALVRAEETRSIADIPNIGSPITTP